jgi:cytochrome c553
MNKLLISLLVSIGISGMAHAAGDAATGQSKAAVCFGCHGADGNSTAPTFPKLASQNENYLVKQLKDIKGGARNGGMMTGFAMGLTEQDMEDLAAFFSGLPVKSGSTDPALQDLGQQIYSAGIQDKSVAACAACHAPTGEGNALAAFPALKGQHAGYVADQLRKFRDDTRANDPSGMMRDVASKLSDSEINAVASYVEGLK